MVMKFASFKEIIDLWPSHAVMRRELRRHRSRAKAPDIRGWRFRDCIPPWWFGALVKAAALRGVPNVTSEELSRLYEARRKPAAGSPQGD